MGSVDLKTILSTWETGPSALVLYAVSVAVALVYAIAAARPSPRGRRWPRGRTVSFAGGMVLLSVIYGSGLEVYEDQSAVHVIQHMLVMMAVPPLLIYAAPITLLLRTLSPAQRRGVVKLMSDSVLRHLNHHRALLVLCADYYLSMFVYQLTPIHTVSEESPVLHFAVHQYFLLCGLCFWFPIAGVDPVRLRLSAGTKLRLVAIGLPAFVLLGAIQLAPGNAATGWAYIASGTTLSVLGLGLIRWHARRRAIGARALVAGLRESEAEAVSAGGRLVGSLGERSLSGSL